MPIRPENKERYPANWPEISKAIRERAGNKCEKCAVPNGAKIMRFSGEDYDNQPVYMMETGDLFHAETGQPLGWELPGAIEGKWVTVVLTVAHLDHKPENCDPANLRCWCQRCHNRYDHKARRTGTIARRRMTLALADLFGGTPA